MEYNMHINIKRLIVTLSERVLVDQRKLPSLQWKI